MYNERLKVVGIGGTPQEGSTSLRSLNDADGDGDITDEGYGSRLDKLGRLVVETAAKLRPEAEPEAQVLRASA